MPDIDIEASSTPSHNPSDALATPPMSSPFGQIFWHLDRGEAASLQAQKAVSEAREHAAAALKIAIEHGLSRLIPGLEELRDQVDAALGDDL